MAATIEYWRRMIRPFRFAGRRAITGSETGAGEDCGGPAAAVEASSGVRAVRSSATNSEQLR